MQSVDFSELNTSMYNTQIKKQKIPSPQGTTPPPRPTCSCLVTRHPPRSPLFWLVTAWIHCTCICTLYEWNLTVGTIFAQLLLLNITLRRFIHIVECCPRAFIFITMFRCVSIPPCRYPFLVNGHLGNFLVLISKNTMAKAISWFSYFNGIKNAF